MNLLEDQFYGELPAEEDVTYNAIRGVVDRLGDRNTTFVDPETAALFDSDMEGHFEGIGARVIWPKMAGSRWSISSRNSLLKRRDCGWVMSSSRWMAKTSRRWI